MSKTLLVTGGAGFIGSEFVQQSIAAGDNVIVLDALTYAGHLANLREVESHSNFHFVHGRIEDESLASKLFDEFSPDAVINFAAESHVDRSIQSPTDFISTNIGGVFNLLRTALNYFERTHHSNFCFVQVSTDEVFGELGDTGKFLEKTAYDPSSPYSASKASGDLLAKAWFRTFGLPVIITNCSNNYGPRQYPEKLIPLMILQCIEGKPLPIYGKGLNVRDWIHVEDHCRGVRLALERGKPGQSYCFGGNAERTNIEVVDLICEILDEIRPRRGGQSYKVLKTFVTDRKGHDYRYAIDDTFAQRELGFTRKHTFEAGLRDTINWYLDSNKWIETVLRRSQ